ncbi:MAG: hypothetical protein ACOYT8_01170 [Candidatus Dependentiae bacterium]
MNCEINQRPSIAHIFFMFGAFLLSFVNMNASQDLDFDAMYQQAEQCGATHIKREPNPVMDAAIKYLKIIFVPLMMVGLKAKKHLTDLFTWTKQRIIILYARAQIMKNYIMRKVAQENNIKRI